MKLDALTLVSLLSLMSSIFCSNEVRADSISGADLDLESFYCQSHPDSPWPVTIEYNASENTVIIDVDQPSATSTFRLPPRMSIPVTFSEKLGRDGVVYAGKVNFGGTKGDLAFLQLRMGSTGVPFSVKGTFKLTINVYQSWQESINFNNCSGQKGT